jgi:hypothetical protein
MTCGHFKKTNNWLAQRYGVDGVIDWNLDKPKPIAAPSTLTPIKATDTQEAQEKEDSTPELPQRSNGTALRSKDGFDDEEDEDAIEALEAIANSSVNGDDGRSH